MGDRARLIWLAQGRIQEAKKVPEGRRAAAQLFGPKFPKRLLKRASWPPVSSSRCWPPVQAGCDFGSMSRRSVSPSLPQVVRVVNSVPSVITILTECYSGWVSDFMAWPRLSQGDRKVAAL